jgi:predicted phosphodiesterase
MVRLLIMSDLHTESEAFELALPRHPDIVLLAGDIGYGAAGVTFARTYFPSDVPVAVICGNHEFFRGEIETVVALCRAEAEATPNVRFLENDEAIFTVRGRNVRVLGCTLWTGFSLFGAQEGSCDTAASRMPDFKLIEYRKRLLRPIDTVRMHTESIEWLRTRLSATFDGPTLVMTHHAPSLKSQHPAYMGDELTPAYISAMDCLLAEFEPTMWVHGHTHWSVDYRLGRTRVYSNQMGFPKQDAGFRLELVEI